MEARKFSQRSYDENDSFAKDKVSKYLEAVGCKIVNREENFEHDLVVENLFGTKVYVEVEVKSGYPFTTMESFRFPTVSFTGRKERLHKINKFIYVIVCKETGWAITCSSKNIYLDQYKEKININTRDRQGADEFYRVPKEFCKFVDLNI